MKMIHGAEDMSRMRLDGFAPALCAYLEARIGEIESIHREVRSEGWNPDAERILIFEDTDAIRFDETLRMA